MPEISPVETELVKYCKFKGTQGRDRQEYLENLVKAIDRYAEKHEDAFFELSDAATMWFNQAVEATHNRQDLPDFPLNGTVAAPPKPEPVEDEDDPEDDDDLQHNEDGAGEDAGPTQEDPDQDARLPLNMVSDNPDDEAAAAEAEAEAANEAVEAAAAKPKKTRAKKPKSDAVPSRYQFVTGEKDEYGIVKGTKTSEAIKLYEQGATVRQVSDKLGGKYYNILGIVATRGHKVEKGPDGVWTVTHKDRIK